MRDLSNDRIIVTGARGFLGGAILRRLAARGVPQERILAPSRAQCDLTDARACRSLLRRDIDGRPATVVLHAAGFVGGIARNRAHPARFFHDNLAMSLHLAEAARLAGLAGRAGVFVQVGTMCSYPARAEVPFREDDLWTGYPDAASASYGIAKLAALEMLRAYRAEHGLASAYVLPVNLYGPGDNMGDPANSHVAGALVKRFVEAARDGLDEVQCWGTGSPTREFLYVDDAAEGVVRAAERLTEPEPVNLGTGREISIRDLASMIARLAGFGGRITWDATRPDGQPRRALDPSRARDRLGWQAEMPLEEGLARTVAWYRASIGA